MTDITIFFVVLIPALVISVIFLLIDYVSDLERVQEFEKKHKEAYLSVLGGVSVSFIFLDVIPSLNRDFPSFVLELILYFFIFFGFVYIHLMEKFILRHVEKRTKKKIDELDFLEDILEKQERKIEECIDEELEKETHDEEYIKKLLESDQLIHKKEKDIESEENELKIQIFNDAYKDLNILHVGTDYATHIFAGILIVNFLSIHYFNAFLFFIFAVMKSLISNPTNRQLKIKLGKEDFTIKVFRGEEKWKKIWFGSSVPTGIVIGFLLLIFIPINQFVYDSLFALIVGIFFYITIREVLPEREKGKPFYFLVGAICFAMVIILIGYLELLVHIH